MAIGNDLKAFYPLDSNADDSWGAHNGTATGISFSGSYATFGGAGDYIEVANSVQLNSATGSVSCWFNTSVFDYGGNGGAVLVGKTDTVLSKNGWNLLLYGGQLHAQIKDGASGSNSLNGGSGLDDGAWHHAVLVFSSGGTSTLYLDGSQIATTGSTISFSVSSQPARMGESLDTNWGSYTGDLDEVAVWSQSLSAADVAAIYSKGRGNFSDFLTLPTGLRAFYPLDTNSNEYLFGVLNGTDTAVTYGSGYATYNGTSSYTEMGNVLNFGTSDFSIAGWVYAVSVPSGGTTGRPCLKFDWTGANYTGFGVTLWHSGGGYAIPNADIIQFHTADGGSVYGPAEITIPGLSTWFHFTVVRSGTNMILYLNGVAVHTVSVGAVADVTTTTKMQLGATEFPGSGGALQDFLDGSLDEMAFWDRAITAVEVAAIHGAGRGNFTTLIPEARIKGMWSSVVHNAGASDISKIEGMWSSVVHNAGASDISKIEGMWGSLVHSVPTPAAIVPDISGLPLVPATFDGSASVMPTYYHWSWVSVPGGSTIGNAAVPFPDSGATTPIDMTGNLGLWHFDVINSTTVTNGSIGLIDTWGDGWHGNNFVTVTVNGTAVLTNITLPSGPGPMWFDYAANPGDTVVVTFTGGTYPHECKYDLNDAAGGTGTTFYSSGTNPTTPYSFSAPTFSPSTTSTTPDTSGGSRDLTVNGATQVAGKVGSYALDFDGTNDYLSYAVADVFPGTTNAISLAFWQYGGVGLGNNSIIRANTGASRVINIHMPYGGQIYFDCGNSGGYDRINKAAPTLSGVWNHWVFTKDVSAGEMKIYLNGALWHSGSGKTKTLTAIDQLYVGSESTASLFYKGSIDEVAVWSRVLSASEVSDIHLLQGGTVAGAGPTHTFTPDVAGTYTINLAINPTTNTNADAVIAAPSGGSETQGKVLQGSRLQGEKLQGDI